MGRFLFALAVVAVCVPVALAASASPPAGFAYGVAAGEITPTSAVLWTRAPKPGDVSVAVTVQGKLVAFVRGRATIGDDLTVRLHVGNLFPGTRYRYAFRQDPAAILAVGTFETAPASRSNVPVRFAFSGDADATPGPTGKPGFNDFQVYGRMAAERNDFNINLGDTIYSDSELPGSPPALTVPAKWAKYKLGLALPNLRKLRANTGLYSQWDDHEFVNDFSIPENGEALYHAGVKAFMDYAPVTYSPRNGLYRTFRWGKNVELFFLDERSFRSAKASAGGVCNNGIAPDLAPTAPAAVRAAFAQLIPTLAQPAPAACIAAIDDPARTFLGARQHALFIKAIQASTATWKVIVNEDPIQQFYQLPYDRWEGYATERTQLLNDLAGVKNAVFLTTDTHANLIGEVRFQTLEAGGPQSTGIWEVVTGPVATNTYAKEIDLALGGKSGFGDLVTSLFLKPPPPVGIGMRCAATDVYSYAEVKATATTLTVTPKTASGGPVTEKTGARCAPLVLTAR